MPDGQRVAFIEGGKIVVRDEAVAAKDGFAARFHLGYLRKIKGDADPAVTSRVPLLPKEVVPKPGG